MITSNEMILKSGPSREELFDRTKHSPTIKEFCVIEFWGEVYDEKKKIRSGSLLKVEIEGLHRAGNSGREWFFWGKLKQQTSGERWVPDHEAKDIGFVFGRWDTYYRIGRIQFGDKSFFKNPFAQNDSGRLTPEEIMERLSRLCRLGTSVMCRPLFPIPSNRWYVSMSGVNVPVHCKDMSGPTPEEAIINTWNIISEKSLTLIRYFCKNDEPVPGNGPQVWVHWNKKIDDWEDVQPPKNHPWTSWASEIRPYAEHKLIEASH